MPRRRFRLPLWRRWWRHPDQSLLRQEVRFGLRWWFRSPGIWLMILFFVPAAIIEGLTVTLALSANDALTVAWIQPFTAVVSFIAVVIVWVHVLLRRTLSLFRPSNLHELLVTPVHPRILFPALLFAPVCVIMIKSAINFAISAVVFLISLPNLLPFASDQAEAGAIMVRSVFSQILISPLSFISSYFYLLALAAWVARRTLPRTAPGLVLLWSTLGSIRLFILPIFFQILLQVALFRFGPTSVTQKYGIAALTAITLLLLLLVSRGVLRSSLRRLRDPAILDRLRQSIEPEGGDHSLPLPSPEPATQA